MRNRPPLLGGSGVVLRPFYRRRRVLGETLPDFGDVRLNRQIFRKGRALFFHSGAHLSTDPLVDANSRRFVIDDAEMRATIEKRVAALSLPQSK